MAKIELQNICKRFGDTPALQDINLSIEDGEFVVFVGPSGCGKSTLLRLIAGLEAPTSGQVLIDGEDATNTAAAKRGLSMVFQSYGLYPHMSVWNNMAFGLKMAKTPADEIERRVRAAAETLQLTDYLHRKPRQLSGGQRQRVAIGRAIVREPRGFLFDEPLSNLDAALRVQMRLEIVQLQRRLATTAIYVTHDQVEAMTMAQCIVVLNGGRVEQTGAPLQLYRQPANLFVAGFIGSPRMNFIGGEWAARRGAATLGARPEHLRLTSPEQGEWTGEVENTEHLGADAYAHVRCEGIGLLTARLSNTDAMSADAQDLDGGGRLPAAGERVGLRADVTHTHLFDADGIALPRAA